MKQVLLDTNFILTCIKQKIDFFEEIPYLGYQIIIPNKVMEELKSISFSKKKLKFRDNAKLALRLIEKNKFEPLQLGKGHTDKEIIHYVKENPGTIVATLDKEIKTKLKGRIMIIREKKRIEAPG